MELFLPGERKEVEEVRILDQPEGKLLKSFSSGRIFVGANSLTIETEDRLFLIPYSYWIEFRKCVE